MALRVSIVCLGALLAACGGVGSTLQMGAIQKPTAQVEQGAGYIVHAGVAFAARSTAPTAARHSIIATYPTTSELLFESDSTNNQVAIYQASKLARNAAPIATITDDLTGPQGLARDSTGTLYVASTYPQNTVTEYPKGQTIHSATITNGINIPSGLAIDKRGTLYVCNYPAAITEYPLGATSPSKTIRGQGMTEPTGLAINKATQDLYIADPSSDQVFEIKRHTMTVVPLNLQGLYEPIGVAFDNLGNLWVTDGEGDKINVYPPGSVVPSQTITTGYSFPGAISIDRRGKAAIANLDSPAVYAYRPGVFTPYAKLTNSLGFPTALLWGEP